MLYLDKRIHRSVKLGDELSNSPNYSIKLAANGTLTIKALAGGTINATVKCDNFFTPPNCGTVINQIYNPNAQVGIDPNDASLNLPAFRFYELHQVLNNPAVGDPTLIVRSTNATGLPNDAVSTLHYQPANAALAETVIPFGDKIPPNLD